MQPAFLASPGQLQLPRGRQVKFSRNSIRAAETAACSYSVCRISSTMRILRGSLAVCCLGLLLSSAVTSVCAREISAQEAVAQAQREAEGKVLSVQTLTVGKHKVYRIKMLTRDGQVRVVQVLADQ